MEPVFVSQLLDRPVWVAISPSSATDPPTSPLQGEGWGRVFAMHDLPSELKNSPPKISIGLVVYNGAEHIRCALDSIVRQSYKNIELIVVDGGSTDGTQDVLNEYAEHISVLVSEPDKGIYDAMNKVNSLATGDWLFFLVAMMYSLMFLARYPG